MRACRIEFDWDPSKEASNRTKHGVGSELAMTVFRDPFVATILDSGHGADEDRWITLGECASGAARGAPIQRRPTMKREYEFASATRGKFHRPEMELVPPVHLGPASSPG
jgi:uncharacterized DUF497 family protein